MNMDETTRIRDVIAALRREGISFDVLGKGSPEEAAAVAWLNTFPIEPWGRIGWSRVKNADCREWVTWDDMIRTYGDLLDRVQDDLRQTDAPILLVWFDAGLPVVRVPFAALRACGAEILDEDFDVWILCPLQRWCIEKYHEGELCYGRIS
jgi:pimeloyl-ACP methyl ester carboxylesterase